MKAIFRKHNNALIPADDRARELLAKKRRSDYQGGQKICAYCGRVFDRNPALDVSQFKAQRFCSKGCAAQVIHRTNALDRFHANMIPEPNSGCWLWLGSESNHGYGQIRINGRYLGAHRLAFEIFHGEIPSELSVLHHCDNRLCVNPDHIYLGTHQQNMRDMVRRGRSLVGTLHKNAVLDWDAVRQIRLADKPDTEFARLFGVSRVAVRNARIGRTWKSQ